MTRATDNGALRGLRPRRRLVYTLFLSFLLVGTVPLILSASKFVGFNRETLGRNLRMIQLETGKYLSSELSAYLDASGREIQLLAEILAESPGPSDFRRRIRTPAFDEFLRKLVQRSNFSEVHVLEPAGEGVRVGRGAGIGPDAGSLLEVLTQSLNVPELMVTPPILGEYGERLLVFAQRVGSRSGTVGVVMGVVELQPLLRRIDEFRVHEDFTVVDRRGVVILTNRPHQPDTLTEPELQAELDNLRGPVVKNFVYTSSRDAGRRIATVVPVRNLDWFVIVEAEEFITFYPLREVIRSTLLWLAVAFLLSGALGLMVSRHISRPVARLVATSKSLASGNFEQRASVASHNEIGELGEHFNIMADRIQGYIEDLRAAVQSNRRLFLESVQTIASAVDEKDPYTRGHSERVTHYSVSIAEEMNLDPEEIETLRVSALLHDVGKIGIPDSILKKPGALNESEFAFIRLHTLKGARLIGQISQLQDVIPGILSHHERLDGSGYPQGLKGAEIPLQARILAVADCLDALTTRRPYQEEIPLDQAVGMIEMGAAVLYDLKVVQALKSAIAKGKIRSREIAYTARSRDRSVAAR